METSDAFFDPLSRSFVCPCRKGQKWDTWTAYRAHRQRQKHPLHSHPYLPQCRHCGHIMLEPRKHSCEAKVQIEIRTEHCFHCKVLILPTTLTRAKSWKSHLYCGSCYRKLCRPVILANQKWLKILLLHGTCNKCVLCERVISPGHETIFEHLNPYLKRDGREITPALWNGLSLPEVASWCLADGVKIVHLICAQLKTSFENQHGEFNDKKWLTKARNKYEISTEQYQEVLSKKIQIYEKVMLPQIKQQIRSFWFVRPFPKSVSVAMRRKSF